jgi:hypothetical protein
MHSSLQVSLRLGLQPHVVCTSLYFLLSLSLYLSLCRVHTPYMCAHTCIHARVHLGNGLRTYAICLSPLTHAHTACIHAQVRLSNGLRVTYRANKQRPNEVAMRISAVGGRAFEDKSTQGSTVASIACWLNGGCGGYNSETVSRFLSMHDLMQVC